MKKILTFLLVSALMLTVSVGHAGPPTIKQSYDSQIGVREATGKNDGVQVEKYLSTVNLTKGYPWCAAFVKWNLLNAGITEASRINGMALTCHNMNNVVYFNRSYSKEVQTADVFTLYYAKLKRIGHTGFVDKRINRSIYRSVEGNTNEAGSREGDGVYVKYRSFNATYSITRWPTST
ncbi:MAG: hypothetical protein LC112_13835 [Flavobacteriales bacterium]|nr:hypothetical protein [Flavobacteriales bacterium]